MAVFVQGPSDEVIDRLRPVFERYAADHPRAEVRLYRRNPGVVRVRVVDPDFARVPRFERNDLVWDRYLADAPEDDLGDITMLLLLAPEEVHDSIINREFEHPSPSLFSSTPGA